jgi:hypothetical protein
LGLAALFPKTFSVFFSFLFYFPLYERGKVVYNIPIVYLGGGTFELFEVRP